MQISTYSRRSRASKFLKITALAIFGIISAIILNVFLIDKIQAETAKVITLGFSILYSIVLFIFARSRDVFS